RGQASAPNLSLSHNRQAESVHDGWTPSFATPIDTQIQWYPTQKHELFNSIEIEWSKVREGENMTTLNFDTAGCCKFSVVEACGGPAHDHCHGRCHWHCNAKAQRIAGDVCTQ
ncbi:MAG: hypothetical protein ACKPKO_25845, partial [Candidatus Fonsibacter sp.]